MKPILIALLAAAILPLSGCAPGGSGDAGPVDEKAAAAVKERKAVLTLMKSNFVPPILMAQDKIPYDAAQAQKNATRLAFLIPMLEDAFATDTRGSSVETEALDVIWEKPDEFAGKIAAAVEAAGQLAAVAGDEDAMKAAAGNLGKKCGSCHDDFRVDDD